MLAVTGEPLVGLPKFGVRPEISQWNGEAAGESALHPSLILLSPTHTHTA